MDESVDCGAEPYGFTELVDRRRVTATLVVWVTDLSFPA
jgi:hypothetical protein